MGLMHLPQLLECSMHNLLETACKDQVLSPESRAALFLAGAAHVPRLCYTRVQLMSSAMRWHRAVPAFRCSVVEALSDILLVVVRFGSRSCHLNVAEGCRSHRHYECLPRQPWPRVCGGAWSGVQFAALSCASEEVEDGVGPMESHSARRATALLEDCLKSSEAAQCDSTVLTLPLFRSGACACRQPLSCFEMS